MEESRRGCGQGGTGYEMRRNGGDTSGMGNERMGNEKDMTRQEMELMRQEMKYEN